jgi:hypothetical protein
LKPSIQTLLDMLEVPQHGRTAGTYRRLAKLMAELGWAAVRVRDLTRGGYKEQVRGLCPRGKSVAGPSLKKGARKQQAFCKVVKLAQRGSWPR